MSREKQIEERLDLSDTIDYAMRDWDNYIDECREEEIPPIDTFEEYIADYVLDAGYRKQSEVAREIFDELDGRLDKICIVAKKGTDYNTFIGVVQQVFDAVEVVLAELKKKYTGDATDTNVGGKVEGKNV